MPYLKNLPNCSEMGIHKTIAVRGLSIDWKHRDSELYLRNPHILNDLIEHYGYTVSQKISSIRSNQLRFIYMLNRMVCSQYEPDNIVDILCFNKQNGFEPLCQNSNIFLDYKCLLDGSITDKKLIAMSCIFSLNCKQTDIVQFFIKNNLPMPRQFMAVRNFNELFEHFQTNISFVLHNTNTFTSIEKKMLWACNFHLYDVVNNGKFRTFSLKSNNELPSPIKY